MSSGAIGFPLRVDHHAHFLKRLAQTRTLITCLVSVREHHVGCVSGGEVVPAGAEGGDGAVGEQVRLYRFGWAYRPQCGAASVERVRALTR